MYVSEVPKGVKIVWNWSDVSVFISVLLHMTVPAQIIQRLLLLGNRGRISKMAFPLAAVEFLILCVGRLLSFFGWSIGANGVEHRADSSAVELLTYKVQWNTGSRAQIALRRRRSGLRLAIYLRRNVHILRAQCVAILHSSLAWRNVSHGLS